MNMTVLAEESVSTYTLRSSQVTIPICGSGYPRNSRERDIWGLWVHELTQPVRNEAHIAKPASVKSPNETTRIVSPSLVVSAVILAR